MVDSHTFDFEEEDEKWKNKQMWYLITEKDAEKCN